MIFSLSTHECLDSSTKLVMYTCAHTRACAQGLAGACRSHCGKHQELKSVFGTFNVVFLLSLVKHEHCVRIVKIGALRVMNMKCAAPGSTVTYVFQCSDGNVGSRTHATHMSHRAGFVCRDYCARPHLNLRISLQPLGSGIAASTLASQRAS